MTEGHKKVGILGGAFNPIHYGHLRMAEEAKEKVGLSEVLFIPSGNPPLKEKGLASPAHRLAMTQLALEGNRHFALSDIECRKPGKSYTVETLEALQALMPDSELYLILGIDAFLDMPAWYQPERLMNLTDLIIVSRPRHRFESLASLASADRSMLCDLDAGLREQYAASLRNGREIIFVPVTGIDISATAIRRQVRQHMSIRYLLPEAVESYIISHMLYREGSDDL